MTDIPNVIGGTPDRMSLMDDGQNLDHHRIRAWRLRERGRKTDMFRDLKLENKAITSGTQANKVYEDKIKTKNKWKRKSEGKPCAKNTTPPWQLRSAAPASPGFSIRKRLVCERGKKTTWTLLGVRIPTIVVLERTDPLIVWAIWRYRANWFDLVDWRVHCIAGDNKKKQMWKRKAWDKVNVCDAAKT